MEQDCQQVKNAHFEVADRWDLINFWLGLSAGILGGGGGTAAGVGLLFGAVNPSATAVFATIVGLLTVVNSFLKPGDRADRYKRAGDKWVTLRDKAVSLYALDTRLPNPDPGRLQEKYEELLKEKEAATNDSPIIPTWEWKKVKHKKYPPKGT